jgi:hypothetical protein
MSSIKDQLLQDLQQAMRAKEPDRKAALRMARAAIQNAEIKEQRELEDKEVEALLAKEVKKRREAVEMFAKGGRQDLVDQEEKQIAILEAYLPEQLSAAEIEAIAQEVIDEIGAESMAQMGPVMRNTMERVQGRADGKEVSEIVRRLLSE